MKAIQAVKKMVALGMGITMVGATIFGASAVQLSDWPAPFVVNGAPASNLAVVVGDAADAIDVVGMGDIVGGLQAAAVVKTTLAAGGGKGVVVEGDAVEIGSTSDLLEINEAIGDVRETITEVDLDMLKGGQIVTDKGSTEYNQYLRFNRTNQSTTPGSGVVMFGRDERDRVGHYLHWAEGSRLFEWELEFEEGLKSKTRGDDLVDLEDEDIIMLGQPFVIVDTDVKSNAANCSSAEAKPDVTIDLMGGAISAILGENDKETYVVDGKEYEVEVLVISETTNNGEGSVKFRINGEITDELEDGETDVLADGTQIGIRDILATGKDIQKSIVQFYIGAYKVTFHDTNTADQTAIQGGTEVNEESIEEAWTSISGTFSSGGFVVSANPTCAPQEGSVYEFSNIKYMLDADAVLGDVYIPPGSGLREQLDEPEGMLTPFWDIRYEGLMDTGVTIVRLDAAGNTKYDLEFTNQEGIFYDVPFASNEGGSSAGDGKFKFGKDTGDLWFIEKKEQVIGKRDYFVLSDCMVEARDNTCFTHVLRYDSADTTNRQLSFTDLGTGTREVVYTDYGTSGIANLVVGGKTYIVNVSLTSPYPLAIDLNGNGVIDNASNSVSIGVQGEGIINVYNGTACMVAGNYTLSYLNSTLVCNNPSGDVMYAGAFTVNLTTLAKEFDEATTDECISWDVVSRAPDKVGVQNLRGRLGLLQGPYGLEENEDLYQSLSGYGVFLEVFEPSTTDKAEDLTIEYPLSQRGARVFVTGGLVSTTTVEGGVTEKVQPLPVGVSKLASEVADITQYNAIVVGGPCANPIAAQLMGNPEPCWESIVKGVAKIYQHANGNVALLAAGRTGQDTRRVARALATGQIASVKSKEAEISGTTMTDITVKAV
ncbi:MAG: hypothetical protein QXT19_04830 [Candidatus Woesearchaeota archaeon]